MPQPGAKHRHPAAGQITLYPVSHNPYGITLGSDGAIWAVEGYSQPVSATNYIAQVTTSGVVTEYPLGFGGAYDGATGSDGNIWITSIGGVGTPLGRITTSGDFTDHGMESPYIAFYDETLGPDGAIWIGDGFQVVRADTNGIMTTYLIPPNVFPGCRPIAVGPDGAFWIACVAYPYGTDSILRMTTGGSFTDYPIPTQNAHPFGIAAGPDGAMWFTEIFADKIGRIDTYGNFTEYQLTAGSQPWGIAAGPDGNLWFAENGRDTIGQITTGGTITEWKVPNDCNGSRGCNPIRITAGSDGAMWFTDGNPGYQGGYVGRITTGPSSRNRRTREQHKDKGLLQGLLPPNRLQP